jgi:putative transposon-encoded protein
MAFSIEEARAPPRGSSRTQEPNRREKDERVERRKEHKRGKRVREEMAKGKVKFEVHGEEMLEKVVSLSGNSGRIYLPPDWVGHQVKIIRID